MLKRALLLSMAIAIAAPAGASAARPCTADDLRGSRAPADLGNVNIETAARDSLTAGTQYRIVVVQEYAIGDNAQPVDGSVVVSAPSGPPLRATTENGRPAYDFTPTGAGTVRIVVSWDERVGRSGNDVCSASQAFDLTVLEPTVPTFRGSFSAGPRALDSFFSFRLFGKSPQDPGKVSVILRARGNSTRPPPPRGRAIGRFTFKPTGDGHFMTSSLDRDLRGTFGTDIANDGFRIYTLPNQPFGRTIRFAFSVEVVQNGKRLGGMRSGAECRRKQFSGHSAIKCRAVGLQQRP
ncbi:MAG: hypothetical protein QOJ12_3476 [Thermoleophilales bacterium]|nr:hypothetical protein [Thermoleophilales bacterium]